MTAALTVAVRTERRWRAEAAAHRERMAAWTGPHRERRRRGEAHPVRDFLFTWLKIEPAPDLSKDAKRFPASGGWGYALFNYTAASDTFAADPAPADCGHTCHVAVKAKDHIFHLYQKR